jgi:hypothetical protein
VSLGSETPTLDCVCDDCNAYFGRELDQLLTRDTYEGVSRYSRGQLSSEARPQRRLNLTMADPAEAGDFVGLRVAVDGTTGQLMAPAAQFHVHNFSTGKDEVYFLHQIAGLACRKPTTECPAQTARREPGKARFWRHCERRTMRWLRRSGTRASTSGPDEAAGSMPRDTAGLELWARNQSDFAGFRWCYGKHGEEVSTGHRSKKRLSLYCLDIWVRS